MALSTTYRKLELLTTASLVVESALTAVGFAVIVYSLHVER